MNKVIGIGDLLVSLTPQGYYRFIQANSFDVSYTGAEANVCVGLQNLGIQTAYVTRLPKNDIAACAVATLRKFGVDVSHIAYGGNRIGVLYMEKGASQRPSKVIYDRKHTAMCEAQASDFDWNAVFSDAYWLHFSGITPALSASTPHVCMAACEAAKKRNIMISCDLNYRASLWTTDQARNVMEKYMPYIDLLIANEEDIEKALGIRPGKTNVISGQLDYQGYVDVAEQVSKKYNIPSIAITLRKSISASDNEWSAMLYDKGNVFNSKKYMIHIVDRVGGGDSFSAGLVYGYLQGFDPQKTIDFAVAFSCLKHTIEHDYNLVTVDEVNKLLGGDASGRIVR